MSWLPAKTDIEVSATQSQRERHEAATLDLRGSSCLWKTRKRLQAASRSSRRCTSDCQGSAWTSSLR